MRTGFSRRRDGAGRTDLLHSQRRPKGRWRPAKEARGGDIWDSAWVYLLHGRMALAMRYACSPVSATTAKLPARAGMATALRLRALATTVEASG